MALICRHATQFCALVKTWRKLVTARFARHERKHQIEIGLVHRVPLRVLAQRFQCSPDALHRHRHRHLSPVMAAAILAARSPSEIDLEQLQRNEAEGLLAQLVTQRARLQVQSDLATELGNASGAIAAERAICSNLELTAKLLGHHCAAP